MNRFRATHIILVFAVLAAFMYFGNPFGTASVDPRGRILGFIPYRFPSNSMLPTIQPGQFLVVSTAAYAFRAPRTGDLVAFFPAGQQSAPFLMRIVARPGQTVALADGTLTVDRTVLTEPYLDPALVTTRYARFLSEQTVPDGMYFILGDNRNGAKDSRVFGPVPREALIGRVVYP